MNVRRWLILGVVTLTSAFGDTFLDVGMKKLPPLSLHHLGGLLIAVRTPWVIAGIVLLIGFFASYLTALSWADLTFVLPATSLGYVIVALLGKYWLHEQISGARWLGIVLITIGVGFVTQGPSYTELPSSGLPGKLPKLQPIAVPLRSSEQLARSGKAGRR
ncbi:MAG TPA: EamA family transporter [Acidisarcina sp.]